MSEWFHSTKGRVVGEVASQDDTWVHIQLAEEAWADVRRRHRLPVGTVEAYRRSRLTLVSGSTSEGHAAAGE